MGTKSGKYQYANDLNLWIGKRLRAIRLERNLTQVEVALLADMHQGRITTAELGEFQIQSGTLARLLQALQTHPADFFKGAPHPPKKWKKLEEAPKKEQQKKKKGEE